MRKSFCILLAVAAVAACEDGTGPNEAFDADAAAEIALETDEIIGEILLDQIMVFAASPEFALTANSADTRTFSRSRPCRDGGSIEVNGTVERTRGDDGVVEFEATGQGKWLECARTRREITRTINGEFTVEAYRKLVNGQHSGPQTTSKEGHFTWSSSTGNSGECDFSITSTRLPDEKVRIVEGTVCGREVHREVTWD